MGVLKIKVGGQWIDVANSNDEVWVGPDTPTDPNAELWYDTDAAVTYSGIPPGGSVGQALVKNSGSDYDTAWGTANPTVPGAWTALGLQNNWVSYDGGVTYAHPQYRKVGDIVYVRGLIKNGTITNGTPVANLPVGFRPPLQLHFPTVSNDAFTLLRILSNGDITVGVGANAGWLSINGLHFSTVT
jgi:hypothetical protein